MLKGDPTTSFAEVETNHEGMLNSVAGPEVLLKGSSAVRSGGSIAACQQRGSTTPNSFCFRCRRLVERFNFLPLTSVPDGGVCPCNPVSATTARPYPNVAALTRSIVLLPSHPAGRKRASVQLLEAYAAARADEDQQAAESVLLRMRATGEELVPEEMLRGLSAGKNTN